MLNPAVLHSSNQTSNITDPGVVPEHCEYMMEGVAVWGASSFLFSLVGFPACVAVFWELFQRHKARTHFTPNDVFMLNLSAMDLVFLFFNPIGVCNFLFWYIRLLHMLSQFLYALNLVGRPLLTACICLDCYLAVVHPVIYRANKSLMPRILACAGVWIITVTLGVMFAAINKFSHKDLNMVVYIVVLPVIVTCDISILWTLKTSNHGGRDLHPRKKKALQIITNSVVMSITSYIPALLILIIGQLLLKNNEVYECVVGIPVLIAPTAGSAIMPVLYLGNLGRLKNLCFDMM